MSGGWCRNKKTDLASLGTSKNFFDLCTSLLTPLDPDREQSRGRKMDKGSENQRVRANKLARIQCNKHMRKCAHGHTLVKIPERPKEKKCK